MSALPTTDSKTVLDEKTMADITHDEGKGSKVVSDDPDQRYSLKDQKRIRRTIDWRIIPALGLMYGISLMDRKNTANAAIAGMLVDLDLNVGVRYNVITLIFFITYVLAQAPITVLCRKLGPRIFLPGCCLLWGGLIIGFGFAKNWFTLIPLRLLLGILEAGYFPGCIYLLGTWYTRYEVARRYAVFYFTGSFASALSGILAYGLMQMEGAAGIRGWRWIFIMEGIITCAIALFSYIVLVPFPDKEVRNPSYKFLKQEEVQWRYDTLQKDRSDVEAEPFSWAVFFRAARTVECWGFAVIFFFIAVVTYSFAFFLPIILRQSLGFSVAASQCLIAPCYVLSGFIMFGTSWYGDRKKQRASMLCLNTTISIIGLPIMAWAPSPGVRYFGAFIGVAGANSNAPTIMAWLANNTRGQWDKAFASAALTGLGGVGGIVGSLIFRAEESPHYTSGFIVCIVANCLLIVSAVGLAFIFKRKNRLIEEGKLVIEENPAFRYTI